MRAPERLASMGGTAVTSWVQLALGACAFVAVAGGFHFLSEDSRAAFGAQTLSSLLFGVQLLVMAGVAAVAVWFGMRLIKGKDATLDFRDSILWSASVIGAMVMMLRMVA